MTCLRRQVDVVSWVREIGPSVCVFDFGGTLLDFEPIHVSAFKRACAERGIESTSVVSVVRTGLQAGLDSFEMARELAPDAAGDEFLEALALRKRDFVEDALVGVELELPTRTMLEELCELTTVAVITRGREESTRAILEGSLPSGVSRKVLIAGRKSSGARLSKQARLQELLLRAGASPERAAYIGDSDEDERIARRLAIPFVLFQPYLRAESG